MIRLNILRSCYQVVFQKCDKKLHSAESVTLVNVLTLDQTDVSAACHLHETVCRMGCKTLKMWITCGDASGGWMLLLKITGLTCVRKVIFQVEWRRRAWCRLVRALSAINRSADVEELNDPRLNHSGTTCHGSERGKQNLSSLCSAPGQIEPKMIQWRSSWFGEMKWKTKH